MKISFHNNLILRINELKVVKNSFDNNPLPLRVLEISNGD
ncbi:hypothetical protein M2133_000650 [Parabacteroides sp. PF5-6]|nr:hypothetical protein [Parabacteroides sp. PF5-6]